MSSKSGKTPLWSIQNEAGWQSWLFGTMHVSDDSAFAHMNKVLPILEKCKLFVAETDLGEIDHAQVQTTFLLPDGKSYLDYLKVKQYNKLRKSILKSCQVDAKNYMFLQPIILTSTIQESFLRRTHSVPLDHYLWKYAEDQLLELKGFEDIARTNEIIGSLDIIEQFRAIRAIGRNPAKMRAKTKRITEQYEAGEIHIIYKQAKKSMGKMRDVLLYNRNEYFVNSIVELFNEYPAFYAVGAGHLSGGKGMISLLRKKGFKVKPV